MNLIDINTLPHAAEVLYEILQERSGDDTVNISHRELPTFSEHRDFVLNHPYAAWYLIEEPELAGGYAVGSIYLTKPPRPSVAGNEIGIFIRENYRGRGIGKKAIAALMEIHGPGRYLANVNPANVRSIGLFEGMGFVHCQNTYALVRE
jgi:RimJ/RimL family protein N-acetyltransferase